MPFSDGDMVSDFRNKITVAACLLEIGLSNDDETYLRAAANAIRNIDGLVTYWAAMLPPELISGMPRIDMAPHLSDDGTDRPDTPDDR